MKKIKRIIAVLLVTVLLMGSFSIFASAVSVSTTNTDYGYMVPTDSKFSKVLSKVTLYGDYDYLNFYINSEYDNTYFFYEIYSDKKCTEVVATDFVQCDSGYYTFSPLLKLKGVFKSGTYYCITYAASINSNTGAVKLSTPSMVSFEITVKRTATFNQLMVPLKTATSTINGPKITWSKLSSTDVKYYYIYRRNIDSSSWTKVGSVSSSTTSFTDTSTKNKNGNYVYSVKAVDKNGSATRYHYGGMECLFVATPTVQSVSTTADDQIQIKWNSTGADRYRLYRKTNGGDWELLSSNISGSNSTYTDYKVVSGNNYEYTVRAGKYFDDDYILSSYNTGKSVDYVAAPKLKPVAVAEKGLNVEWEAVDGATGYTVYRKALGSAESWTILKKVSAGTLTYNDTTADSNGCYAYTVRSEGKTSRGSYLSSGIEIFTLKQPEFSVSVNEKGIHMTWEKDPCAEYYQVCYKKDDGSWSVYAKTSNCYYDISPTNCDVYELSVRGARGSARSTYEKNVEPIVYYPKINLSYQVFTSHTKITWNDVDADSYNLYRKLKGSGDSSYELIYSGKNSSFLDENVEYDVAYTYCVKAVYNSVEQSMNLTAKNITRYSPQKYINSFKAYLEDRGSDGYRSSTYEFEKQKNDAAAKMKSSIYVQCKEDIFDDQDAVVYWQNKGDTSSIDADNNYFYYSGPEGVVFGFVVYDSNGSTPIDAVTCNVSKERCSRPIIRLEAVKDGLKIYWTSVDDAAQYSIIETKNNILDKTIKANGSSTYSVTIPASQIKKGWNLGFMLSAVHTNGNVTVSYLDDFDYCSSSPKLLGVIAERDSVRISWMGPSGFNDYCQKYVIFRKAPGDASWTKLATVNANSSDASSCEHYYDKTAKSGVKYKYTVRVYDTYKSCYASYYDTAGLEVGKLAAPTLVSAENTADGINIKWKTNQVAQGYYIYRKTSGTDWKRITTIYDLGETDTCTYKDTDKSIKAGTTYYYTVKAFWDSNISSCDSVGISTKRITVPSLTSATNTANGIKVAWGKVTGAEGYYVYRKTSNTDWKRLDDVSGTSFTDKTVKSGTTYYYTVRAYSGSSISSYIKNGISVKCLATPVLSSATNATSGVTVNWGKVTGAGGYYIYRKTSDSGWKRIATVSGGSTVTYKDETAKAGVTYTYTVRAYSGSTMSYFDEGGVTVKRLTRPSLTSATRSSSGITVKWGKVTGASGYYVYRKTSNSGWEKVGTVKSGSTISYKDTTAKSGTTYYYTVKAYSGSSSSAYVSSGIKCK